MDDVTKTDKMLSRKEGASAIVIFNNPERHNAVSLEMWDAHRRDPRRLSPRTTRCAWSSSPAPAANRSCRAPISRSSRASARRWTPPSTTTTIVGARQREHLRVSEADHRHDPRLLYRRRAGAGGLLRSAHLLRQFEIRRPGGEAWARLFLSGRETAHRLVGAGLRQGNLLHRAPVRCRGGACDGTRQPHRAGARNSKAM